MLAVVAIHFSSRHSNMFLFLSLLFPYYSWSTSNGVRSVDPASVWWELRRSQFSCAATVVQLLIVVQLLVALLCYTPTKQAATRTSARHDHTALMPVLRCSFPLCRKNKTQSHRTLSNNKGNKSCSLLGWKFIFLGKDAKSSLKITDANLVPKK